MRVMRLPISLRSFASGQSYLQFAMTFSSLARIQPHASGFRAWRAGRSHRSGVPHAGRFEHCVLDAMIRPTTAEVPAQALFHLFERRMRMLIQERAARHHESRGAEPALLGVVIDKGRDDRIEVVTVRKRFNSCDLVPLGL